MQVAIVLHSHPPDWSLWHQYSSHPRVRENTLEVRECVRRQCAPVGLKPRREEVDDGRLGYEEVDHHWREVQVDDEPT